jgi:hypothetical protein
MDGDEPDFATANYCQLRLFRRGTASRPSRQDNHPTSAHLRDLVSADLDGDGFVDLAVARDGIGHASCTIAVRSASIRHTTFSVGAAFARWRGRSDHDGKVDLVVPIARAGGSCHCATWAAGIRAWCGDHRTDNRKWLLARPEPRRLGRFAIANGDGNPYADGSMRVVLNAANGGFLPAKDYADVPFSKSITAADFTGDLFSTREQPGPGPGARHARWRWHLSEAPSRVVRAARSRSGWRRQRRRPRRRRREPH